LDWRLHTFKKFPSEHLTAIRLHLPKRRLMLARLAECDEDWMSEKIYLTMEA
jgi:hypothetical protein